MEPRTGRSENPNLSRRVPLATRRQVLRLLAGAGLIPLCPALGRLRGARLGGYAWAGTAWASGGTVAMTDKDTYPDPFDGDLGPCLIVATTTQGPCTTQTDLA